jgi:hypothetical protein
MTRLAVFRLLMFLSLTVALATTGPQVIKNGEHCLTFVHSNA